MNAVIVSHAADTNGGNERFARAAKKHGADVLSALAIGNADPAFVIGRYKSAADKLGWLNIRSVARPVAYFDWPQDIVWSSGNEPLIRKLMANADVIHMNNSYRSVQRYHLRKPMLLHHHGSLFRNNTGHMLAIARQSRWVQAVSTLDLTRPDPDVLHWLPSAYDIAELRAFGEAHRRADDGRLRIVHCPTNRQLKSTDALIAAVAELQSDGLPVDLVIVEGQTWAKTMEAKAQADVVFDQTLFGYGCNAIEAWAMGIPVIAGADDWTLDTMRKTFGTLPFELATNKTIASALRRMRSDDYRAEMGDIGHAHVLKYHDERPALARLVELYMLAIETYQRRAASAADAVSFRNDGRSAIRLDGMELMKPGADIRTDDAAIIARLRYFARQRPRMGVTEIDG